MINIDYVEQIKKTMELVKQEGKKEAFVLTRDYLSLLQKGNITIEYLLKVIDSLIENH